MFNTTPLPFALVIRLNGKPDSLRLLEQMIWPHLAVSRCDNSRTGLIADQHGNLCVRKPTVWSNYSSVTSPCRHSAFGLGKVTG
jgi:hypothetical protein